MKRLHIFNPASGGGHSPELLTKGSANGEEAYVTTGIGDAERFVYNICKQRPETHFVVYGGDGTINEVANGIMKADAGRNNLLSVVPAGTGNDFVRTFVEKNKIFDVDVIKYRSYSDTDFKTPYKERYAVNTLNVGFDSHVVKRTDKYKKIFSGGASYIAGLADEFCRKIGEKWSMEFENAEGLVEKLDGEFILALCANGRYYGGGFRAAPLADLSDGLVDFVAFKKPSKAVFLSLVGDYKKGKHLDPLTLAPAKRFEKYMIFEKCKSVKISGIRDVCADGEIDDASSVEITCIPKALRIAT